MQSLNEKLKEITQRAQRERTQLRAFAKTFPQIFEFAQAFAERTGVSSAYCSHNYGGSFTVNINNLNGFRGETFVDNLMCLEQFFRVDLEMEDHPEYNMKQFIAKIPHKGGTLDIRVEARLASDSAQCHRIVIGEETSTVTTPIYKLVCP